MYVVCKTQLRDATVYDVRETEVGGAACTYKGQSTYVYTYIQGW